jgi:aspartyl-tRNA(Asn)/glutamyl-tRNA(Gln) amidotransferase subunit C
MERDELEITAQLARLDLSEADALRLEAAVARMLEYFSKMRELDVDGVPPTTQLVEDNRTREDTVVAPEYADSVLANAPELEDRFIVIPNVL